MRAGAQEEKAMTWGVWDRANLAWVGHVNKSEDEARHDAARWNVVYVTVYYVARNGALK
jgi:hypothetical protein